MSKELSVELAVCVECHSIYQSAFAGSPCMDSDCGGEYERVKFWADAPTTDE